MGGLNGAVGAMDDGLFPPIERTAAGLLRHRYQEPPFTVLDRRAGPWLERDRQWKALGIQSEIGRPDGLLDFSSLARFSNMASDARPQSSVFSPALCELVYRWYSRPGAQVLDPFAGGSVRGVVASALGRWYTGIELRREQVAANRAQSGLAGPLCEPLWIQGDAADIRALGALPGPPRGYDLVFSCPPYAYLERYSDDPRDLSTMTYDAFLAAYRAIIHATVSLLAADRFVAWVVGEVRDKSGQGACLGFVPDTIRAMRDAGLHLYNDHIILRPVGTGALRAPGHFDAARKAERMHEYLLVFVKGDARRATAWLNEAPDEVVPDIDLAEEAA